MINVVTGLRGREGGAGTAAARTVKMTLEVYTQAVTPAKRKARSKLAGLLKAGAK